MQARRGKDIQGIPWDQMQFTREKYRETRLREYKNYENLRRSHDELEKVYTLLGSAEAVCNHFTKTVLNAASFLVTGFLRTWYLHSILDLFSLCMKCIRLCWKH